MLPKLKNLLALIVVAALAAGAFYLGMRFKTTEQSVSTTVVANKAIAELATRTIVWRIVFSKLDWTEDQFLDVVYTVKVGYDFEKLAMSRRVDEAQKQVFYDLPEPMIISLDDKLQRNFQERKSMYARLFSSSEQTQRERDLMEIQMLARDCERYDLFALEALTEKLRLVLAMQEPGYQVVLVPHAKPNAFEMFKRYVQTKAAGPAAAPSISPTNGTDRP